MFHFLWQVSHIDVEQELVTISPSVKVISSSSASTASSTTDAHQQNTFQLLLVPSSSCGQPTTSTTSSTIGSRLSGAVIHSRRSHTIHSNLSEGAAVTRSGPTTANTKASLLYDGLESVSTVKSSVGTVSVGVAVQVSTASYVPAPRPAIAAQRSQMNRPQPPPIPPRNIRLTVNYPGSHGEPSANSGGAGSGSSSYKPMHRGGPYREPPLMEESGDSATDNNNPTKTSNNKTTISSSSSGGFVQQKPRIITAGHYHHRPPIVPMSSSSEGPDGDEDSDAETNSRSGMMPCVSNANDGTSIESLVLEETALLLPATLPSGRSLMRNITERDEDTLI